MDPVGERLPDVPVVPKPVKRRKTNRYVFVRVFAPLRVNPLTQRVRAIACRALGSPKINPGVMRRLLLATHPDRGGCADEFRAVLQLSRNLKAHDQL
jgi:hypothetical protein